MSRRAAHGLLLLAALAAFRVEASRPSVWESNPHAAVFAKTDATGLHPLLEPVARLDTTTEADSEIVDSPRFDLGVVVFAEGALEHEERSDLGPLELLGPTPLRGPPPSYPETRVRGFELLPPFRVGASPTLRLWSRQACGSISCALVSDSPQDPWGLSERTMEMKEQACRVTGTGCPGNLGTVDLEAAAKEVAATAVEELSYVGIANGVSSSLFGYDFVRNEKVEGPLARILAGVSAVPGIPATIRKIDEIPGLKSAAKFDLPGGAPGTVGNWVEGLKRWDTPTAKRSGLFEVEQTGPFNFRVHGGGEKVDIDGFFDTTVLDAKFVDKPNVSPFVPGSDIKPEIRKVIQDKVRNEFRRLSAVIADPAVPFRRLEVRVNDPKAAPFFESLMSEYGIPGAVNIVETGVKRKGAP